MNLPDLLLLLLHQLLQDLLLLPHNIGELHIHDLRVQLTTHQRGALVLLDEALVDGLGQLQVSAEPLLLEVTHRVFISEGEEVVNTISDVIILDNRN